MKEEKSISIVQYKALKIIRALTKTKEDRLLGFFFFKLKREEEGTNQRPTPKQPLLPHQTCQQILLRNLGEIAEEKLGKVMMSE